MNIVPRKRGSKTSFRYRVERMVFEVFDPVYLHEIEHLREFDDFTRISTVIETVCI